MDATAALLDWLPGFWALTQQQLPLLASQVPSQAAMIECSMAAAEQAAKEALATYRQACCGSWEYLPTLGQGLVISHPAGLLLWCSVGTSELLKRMGELGPPPLLDAAAELASGMYELEAGGAPEEATTTLRQLATQACSLSVSCLSQRMRQDIQGLITGTSWQEAAAGADAHADRAATVVDSLGRIVGQTMQHASRVAQLAGQAQLDYECPVHSLFVGCFTAAAAEMEQVALAAMQALRTQASQRFAQVLR